MTLPPVASAPQTVALVSAPMSEQRECMAELADPIRGATMSETIEREASGTLEQRVAEVRARMEGVTPGPWFVWDGIGYFGGGRDLCIGAGPTWLANMGHRGCERYDMHMQAMQLVQDAEMFAKGHSKCAPAADVEIMRIAETCDLAEQFTDEQIADANFIARAREDVPFLLSVIDYLNKAIEEEQSENFRLRHRDYADEGADAASRPAHPQSALADPSPSGVPPRSRTAPRETEGL